MSGNGVRKVVTSEAGDWEGTIIEAGDIPCPHFGVAT